MREGRRRFDAGYPGEPLMAALEERGTHYVARVRMLKRLALPAMDAAVWAVEQRGARWRAPHLGLRVVRAGSRSVPGELIPDRVPWADCPRAS